MMRFASAAMSSSSSFILRPSFTRRIPSLFSPFESHFEIASFCRRKFFISSKSSPDPIDYTESVADQKLQKDFDLQEMACDEGFEIEIQNVEGKMNRRRIRSRIRVNAALSTLWRVLTDYVGLARFLPSLAVSQLLEKREKFARVYQVGEQNLALGLKFKARGVLECYEGDVEDVRFGWRRDVEFRMVEGDFQTFEGRWCIEQIDAVAHEDGEILSELEYRTTLSYIVEVEPKLWLPVRLIEGRICNEVKINLLCIRDEAQRIQRLETDVISSREAGDDLCA